MKRYKDINKWEVLTPAGWAKFQGILQTEHEKYLELKFSNNKELKCSYDHKLKLNNGRVVPAIELFIGDKVATGDILESKVSVKSPISLYELIKVTKGNLYYTNELTSANCASISHMSEIWASAGLTLTRSNGKCIIISCVTKDTYIFTDKGIQQLEDFIPENINHNEQKLYTIAPYNVKGKGVKRKGEFFYCNGYVPTRKIITPFSNIETSHEHKFWSYKDGIYQWVKAKELKIDDWVCVEYGMNCWGNNDDISDFKPSISSTSNKNTLDIPSKLTPNWCYFLGLYISEGSVGKNDKGHYNGITISCGDGITDAFINLKLKYYLDPIHKVRHQSCNKTLVEFMEYLGFDLSQKASKKEIPKRLFSISKENMKALLQGIFDGDGYSTIKNNRIGINLKSPKLIEQVRIILLNFGVLSLYREVPVEKLNSYFSKKGIIHRYNTHTLEINNHFASIFHQEIGFRLERKSETQKKPKVYSSFLPDSNKLARELCKLGKTSFDTLRTKHKVYIHYDGKPCKEKILEIYNFIGKTNPEFLELPRVKEIKDKVLIDNTMWTQIKKIEEKENYTWDFSLPETGDKTWCHSVVYNGILNHQTPRGTQGWYFEQYTNAKQNGWNIIDAHWTEHPIYNIGLYQYIKDSTKKGGGYIKFFNDKWPDLSISVNSLKYGPKNKYKFITDGKVRSPWYDIESIKLGVQKTRCELDCAFSGSGGEVLDPDVIRGLELKTREYKSINGPERGAYKSYLQYFKYEIGHEYVLSCDCSTGDGSDYSAFVIIDTTDMIVVATFKDMIDPKTYAQVINEKGKEYKALVIIEYQYGLTTLLELKDVHKYPQIYKSVLKKNDATKREKVKKLGFWQSNSTRTLGGDKLEEVFNTGELKVPCLSIINELHTWIWSKQGRRDHADGKHDDLLMSLTMAMFFVFYIKPKYNHSRTTFAKSFEVHSVRVGEIMNGYDQTDF